MPCKILRTCVRTIWYHRTSWKTPRRDPQVLFFFISKTIVDKTYHVRLKAINSMTFLRIACCRFLIYVLFFQQRNRNRNNFMEISYVMKILRNFTIMWPKTQNHNTTPNTQHQQKKLTIWLASVIWQKKVMAEKKRSNIHVRVSLSLSFHVLSYFHIVRCF